VHIVFYMEQHPKPAHVHVSGLISMLVPNLSGAGRESTSHLVMLAVRWLP